MTTISPVVPKKKVEGAMSLPAKKRSDLILPTKVTLPDELSNPATDISQLGIVIYGATGIGKSSLVSKFGKPFFFRFEPSSKFLRLYQTPVISKWDLALSYLRAAEEDLKGYTTFSIDTAGPAWDRCLEFTCERLGISHPGKVKDYGASWKEVQKEFHIFHSRIASLGVGLIVIAHESTEDIEAASGAKYSHIVPHFSGWTMDFYKRWVDVIGYYFYTGLDERYLLIRGTELIMAKCNTEDHFLTTTGERVVCIPMGHSADEAYQNFMRAFNNQQEGTYAEKVMRNVPVVKKLETASTTTISVPLKKLPKKTA